MPIMTHRAIEQADAWKWQAFEQRDAGQDGAFVVAVRTTGIYCRPSCPARRPKPENVLFFDLNREAEAAGFRPCKRCRPNEISTAQAQAAAVERACRIIEMTARAPRLDELAAIAGLSPFHFHRLFKRMTGTTPKGYARGLRERREARALASSETRGVTDAIYAAGYETTGRFYDGATERLGMTPQTYRRGGDGQVIRYGTAACWLGRVLVAATDKGICAVRFGDDDHTMIEDLARRFPQASWIAGDQAFAKTVARVVEQIERPHQAAELPLDIQGTLFEQQVWAALRAIPCGETRSYSDIASEIGRPTAVRAVAQACARNPVAVLTPCHRVVAKSGALSGYRWGSERKAKLLAREAEER